MTEEDEEFNRIEREAKQRMEAVKDTLRYRDAFPKDYRLPKPWVGLDLAEMDAIIDGNMTITDSKLRDAVYAVVIDTMTTLMEKNHG
jgi:hypothetical protein